MCNLIPWDRGTGARVHGLESQTAALTDYLGFSFPQSSPQPSEILGPFQMNHSLVELEIVIIKRVCASNSQ